MIRGKFREALTVERDVGGLEAVDAGGGVDAHDPKLAEVALLAATTDNA